MAFRPVPPTTSYSGANDATTRKARSFATLYERARKASTNDNADQDLAQDDARQNRQYIEELHERVDTLRGELLVRVIQAGATIPEKAPVVAGDISRLTTRLDKLREKLRQEETRLSGKLIDVEV